MKIRPIRSLNEEAIIKMFISFADEFPHRQRQQTLKTNLNGGEIAGVVIGALLLIGVSVGLVYVLFHPPELVRRFIDPVNEANSSSSTSTSTASSRPSTSGVQTTSASNIISFSNPLDEQYAEVQIKD